MMKIQLLDVTRKHDGSEENCAIPASKDYLIVLPDDKPIQLSLL